MVSEDHLSDCRGSLKPPARLMTFLWPKHKNVSCWRPPLSVTATGSLRDRVDTGNRSVNYRKIHIHAGFNQLCRNDTTRFALLEHLTYLLQLDRPMCRIHPCT